MLFEQDEYYKVEIINLCVDMSFALDYYDVRQLASSLSSYFLLHRTDNEACMGGEDAPFVKCLGPSGYSLTGSCHP